MISRGGAGRRGEDGMHQCQGVRCVKRQLAGQPVVERGPQEYTSAAGPGALWRLSVFGAA
ncbi:MAG: hypothetical protein ACLFTI_04315 [Anaerolineales bacterium]